MIKRILLSLFCICLALCSACSPAPEIMLLDSLVELEVLMNQNLDQPDELIRQLNIYAKNERWTKIHRAFEKMDSEQRTRVIDQNQIEYSRVLQSIVNLDLAIQDQLASDPVKLNAYHDAIQAIRFENEKVSLTK